MTNEQRAALIKLFWDWLDQSGQEIWRQEQRDFLNTEAVEYARIFNIEIARDEDGDVCRPDDKRTDDRVAETESLVRDVAALYSTDEAIQHALGGNVGDRLVAWAERYGWEDRS